MSRPAVDEIPGQCDDVRLLRRGAFDRGFEIALGKVFAVVDLLVRVGKSAASKVIVSIEAISAWSLPESETTVESVSVP